MNPLNSLAQLLLKDTTVVSKSTLGDLFQRKVRDDSVICTDVCQNCGRKIQIRIDRTSGGFGLLGGILHETKFNKLYSECLDCYFSRKMPPDAMEGKQLSYSITHNIPK